ncbi:hypothetical protein WJX73_003813 [Symbiochloris irregularis]|uniref:Uncharacterized protein n=1 Tax=Symbiochloris irregularis TaxID=706552 RepID=A0AAW1NWW8_9CHLO
MKQLRERSQDGGVLAYGERPQARSRPNERFLQNTLRNLGQANRRADEDGMWASKRRQEELYVKRARRRRTSSDREEEASQPAHASDSGTSMTGSDSQAHSGPDMSDQDMTKLLTSRNVRGRGGIGTRADQIGPQQMDDDAGELRVAGPARPPWLQTHADAADIAASANEAEQWLDWQRQQQQQRQLSDPMAKRSKNKKDKKKKKKSKALRDLAYKDDELWRTLAAASLNPDHPSLQGHDRAAVQGVMLRRMQARHNVCAGKIGSMLELRSNDHPSSGFGALFSPCGSRLFLDYHFSHSVFTVEEGTFWLIGRQQL